MSEEEEIRLMGLPVKITMPGVCGEIISKRCGYTKNSPTFQAGKTYDGYAWCDLDDEWSYSWKDIYVSIDDNLYSLDNYIALTKDSFPINKFITKSQVTVTFEKIYKMLIFLYNRMERRFNELESNLNDRD